MSDPLIETQNPNELGDRAPGDPTESWNADGSPANSPLLVVATAPINPVPDPHVSDPAFVPSPYQPPEVEEALTQNARLREVALQAENRFVPRTDKTPHVDPALVVTPTHQEQPVQPQPVWDPVRQQWVQD